jgi:uncharacterized tellurite resistance protein B-like protein
MNRPRPQGRTEDRSLLADAIRRLAHEIEALPEATTALLEALSFVLARVADADREVSSEEALAMERALADHTGISPAQAALVVEIAKHRARLADRGMAYASSRLLRDRLDDGERVSVLGCLHAIASADGDAAGSELDEILQVAAELGFTGRDVAAFRRRQLRA